MPLSNLLRLAPFILTLTALPLCAQTNVTYADGQTDVTAYDTSSPNSPLTLTVASGSASQSGILSGSGAMIKNGGGTLSLTAGNTYTGSTTVNAGTLAVADAGSLGSGALFVTGGATLDLGGTTQSVGPIGTSSARVVGNITAGTLASSTGHIFLRSGTFDNTFTLANGYSLIIGGDTSATVHLNGTINSVSDTSEVAIGVIGQAGRVELGNPNGLGSASQVVTISAGTLDLNGQAGVQTKRIHTSGGQLINDDTENAASYTGEIVPGAGSPIPFGIGGAGDLTLYRGPETGGAFSGFIRPSPGYHANLEKIGTGTLTLATWALTYEFTVSEGILQFGDGDTSGGVATGTIINNSVVVFYSNSSRSANQISITGSGVVIKNGTSQLELRSPSSYTGGTVLNSGGILVAYDDSLGSGTLTINQGSLRAFYHTSSRTLANDIVLAGDFTLGAGIHLAGDIQLTRDVTITSANLEFVGAEAEFPFDDYTVVNTLSGIISGSHGLTFAQGENPTAGIALTGANTYTGATTVNAGRLVVNGSLASSSLTTVNSGGTLSGTGTVGALTIASGGTLAPGNSPGTLSVAGSATWHAGANYIWEINSATGIAGTNWDFLSITGNLDLSALTSADPFIIELVSLLGDNSASALADFDSSLNYSYAIATATGGIVGFEASAFSIGTDGFLNDLLGGVWSIALDGNNLNLHFTAVSAVPEPSTYAALAGLVMLATVALRRKRPAAPKL